MNFIITQSTIGQNVPLNFLDEARITIYIPRTSGYYGGRASRWQTKKTKKLIDQGDSYTVNYNIDASEFALVITRGNEVLARTNLITTDTFTDIELVATRTFLGMPGGYLDGLPTATILNNEIDDARLNILSLNYENRGNGRFGVSADAQFRTRSNGNFKPIGIDFSFELQESNSPIWDDESDDAYLVVHKPDLDLSIRNAFFYSMKPIIRGLVRPKIIKNINDSLNNIIATNNGLEFLENLSGAFTFNESPLLADRLRGIFLEKQ